MNAMVPVKPLTRNVTRLRPFTRLIMNMPNKLKSSIIWSLLARGFGAGSGFLITALMARLLSVEALGVYYLALNIIRFGSHFAKAGMEISLQKLLGVAAAQKNPAGITLHLACTGIILAATSTLLLMAMLILWKPLTSVLEAPALSSILGILFLLIVSRSIEELASAFFRGVHEARIGVFLLDGPRQLAMLILLCAIWFSADHLSPIQAINVYLISSSVTIAGIFLLLGFWCSRNSVDIRRLSLVDILPQAKKDLLLSLPMMAQGIAVLINSTFDIWALSIFSSKEDVAVYGTIVRLVTLITLIMSVSNMVIPPLIAAMYERSDRAGIERLLKKTTNGTALIIIPLILAFIFWGGPLLRIVFGPQFEGGAPILLALSIAYGYIGLTGSPGWLLQMAGEHRHLMQTSIATGMLNMAANVIAAMHWGALGVAVATSFCIILQDSLNMYFAYRKLGVRTWFNPLRRIESASSVRLIDA